MDRRDARLAIGDLPLDLFGEPEVNVPSPPREPDTACWNCGFSLTDGLATCSMCGAQNELIPIVTSTPPQFQYDDEDPALPATYAGRVARVFVIISTDILRSLGKLVSEFVHHVLDWSFLHPHRRD